MQIQLRDAILALNTAKILCQNKWPHGPAMALYRMVRELTPLVNDYAAERKKLLDTFAQKDAAGQFVVVDGHYQFEPVGNKHLFLDAEKELLETPVEVKTTLEARGLEKIEIEPALLLDLGDLFVLDKE